MICEPFDIATVPFPFSDRRTTKRRPAVVISSKFLNGCSHTVMAMITSKSHTPWPGDTSIEKLESSGLKVACLIRFKIFTIDNRLMIKKIGTLSVADRKEFQLNFKAVFLGAEN